MKSINLKNWEEFGERLNTIKELTGRPNEFLFRGQADAAWSLRTTHERYSKLSPRVTEYCRIMQITRSQIETGTHWNLPDYDTLMRFWQSSDSRKKLSLFGELPGLIYMIYLRHHGFPSPLLDWSGSPYVAAYFAFNKFSLKDRAIYTYSEMAGSGKAHHARQPEIYTFGPSVGGHKRHFLQQSQYTLCFKFVQDAEIGQKEWRFSQHDSVFDRGESDQDVITKFIFPSTERVKILKLLDEFNLNAFSLFGSEESLRDDGDTRIRLRWLS